MRVFKLSLIFVISALFMTACTRSQIEQVYTDRTELGTGAAGFGYDNDAVWARENLDLQAVGELLPLADDASELEYLLNNQDGINNLDLNGDGYVDYISVREFDDRYDDERGFSLYSMFGPDEIQEICTIIFDRDGYNDGYYPGARVLLTGNEHIYGDNYYYESNWLDRSLPIVSWLFTDRNDYYRSPYYYGYYPDYYEPYAVVETVVYQERIREYYPDPIFVYTAQPTFVEEVKIASPYREKTMTKVYANMAKPTRQQVEFKQKNPDVSQVAKVNRQQVKDVQAARPDKQFKENQNRFDKQQARVERQQLREKPNKQDRPNFERQNQARVEKQNQVRFEKEQRRVEQQQQRAAQNQQRFEQRQQQQVQRQQQQVQRQQMRVERQQQPRFERPQQQRPQQQQQRFERPQKPQQQRVERPQQQQSRPQPNNGGGNPNKGGGGNPNKGGGNGGGGGGKKGKG